ncbi:hypothetical protein LXL04_024450 [Taraxacum kok-saghyz]
MKLVASFPSRRFLFTGLWSRRYHIPCKLRMRQQTKKGSSHYGRPQVCRQERKQERGTAMGDHKSVGRTRREGEERGKDYVGERHSRQGEDTRVAVALSGERREEGGAASTMREGGGAPLPETSHQSCHHQSLHCR